MVKGFQQIEGIDYTKTFKQVGKPTTICIMFSLTFSQHWCIKQLDINITYLNGDIVEEVYMSYPLGFVDAIFPSHVFRLKNFIYGLKQALRAYFLKFNGCLLEWGFHGSNSNASMIIYKYDDGFIVFLIYIDDIIVTRNNSGLIQTFINKLNKVLIEGFK